jgi:pimeloyl-ACP methyl ester carboxylesterase
MILLLFLPAVGIAAEAMPTQRLVIPMPAIHTAMQTDLYLPPGKGPFRLALIAHGSDEASALRKKMAFPRFPAITAWLLAHNYAVAIPERPGHGETGGPYLESQGACLLPDYAKAGLGAAASLAAALDYLRTLPSIRHDGAVVIGNSAGGWGALALASQNPPSVAGIVNVSGGRGGRNHNVPGNNCAPDRLVSAAGQFGATARIPTLWLYARNDSYFAPALAQAMANAFTAAGGKAQFTLLPEVRGDGHALINTAGPEASWAAPLSRFLKRIAR